MKASRIIVCLMLIFTLLSCSQESETTDAEDFFPFAGSGLVLRWNAGSTIRVLLQSDSEVTTTGYSSEFRTAFMEGVAAWDSTLQGFGISITYVTSGQNDISVVWNSDLGSALGIAFVNTASDPSRFILMATQFDGEQLSADTVRAVAIHEMGHMLGLFSHSFDPADIMYPILNSSTLTNRDTGTMQKVYTIDPDVNLSTLTSNSGDLSSITSITGDALTPGIVFEDDLIDIIIFCKTYPQHLAHLNRPAPVRHGNRFVWQVPWYRQ